MGEHRENELTLGDRYLTVAKSSKRSVTSDESHDNRRIIDDRNRDG